MAAVTICSDFRAPQNSLTLFPLFPYLFAMKWWDQMPWSSFFWMLSFKPTFSLSSFTFTKRLFSSSSLSAVRFLLWSRVYQLHVHICSLFEIFLLHRSPGSTALEFLVLCHRFSLVIYFTHSSEYMSIPFHPPLPLLVSVSLFSCWYL